MDNSEESGETKQTSTSKPQGPVRAVTTQVTPSSKSLTFCISGDLESRRGVLDEIQKQKLQCGDSDSDGAGRYKLFDPTISESKLFHKLSVIIPVIVDQNRGGEGAN